MDAGSVLTQLGFQDSRRNGAQPVLRCYYVLFNNAILSGAKDTDSEWTGLTECLVVYHISDLSRVNTVRPIVI